MTFHTQGKGFQTLKQQKCAVWRQGGTGIAQWNDTGTGDIGCRTKMFAVVYAVVRRIRLIEGFFKTRIACPLEFAAVDNGTANRCTVTADVFGQGLDNDVGAMLDRAEQRGRSDGIIYRRP